MLNLLPSWTRDCEGIHRREFLRVGALTGLGLSLPMWLARNAALAKDGQSASDVSCILIWTGGGTAGYLGLEHNPFEIFSDANSVNFSVRDITLPQGLTLSRFQRRRGMLRAIDSFQRQAEAQVAEYESLDQHYQAALNLITAP